MENREILKDDARNRYRSLTKTQKDIKRKYQIERYHMNTVLNEKLNQYEINYYASKKVNETLVFVQYKNE